MIIKYPEECLMSEYEFSTRFIIVKDNSEQDSDHINSDIP